MDGKCYVQLKDRRAESVNFVINSAQRFLTRTWQGDKKNGDGGKEEVVRGVDKRNK
jgi:hypothetical protein